MHRSSRWAFCSCLGSSETFSMGYWIFIGVLGKMERYIQGVSNGIYIDYTYP
jgi:hypothetical protein